MNKLQGLALSALVAALAGISMASSSDPNPAVAVIRGVAEIRQPDGQWSENAAAHVGEWIRSTKSDTTVRLPGVTLRMEPGASVRLSKLGAKDAKIDAKGGRIYVKVDADRSCLIASRSKQVQANHSEFILDAGNDEKFYLVQGQASLINAKPQFETLNPWSKSLALDGPDVRRRSKNRKRFTQGEENKGKKIGEDAPPNTPTYTPPPNTPAYTPPPTPPSPPPSNPPPQQPNVGGGGQAWPWIVGGLLVGGGTYFVTRDKDGNPEPFRAVFPISP